MMGLGKCISFQIMASFWDTYVKFRGCATAATTGRSG